MLCVFSEAKVQDYRDQLAELRKKVNTSAHVVVGFHSETCWHLSHAIVEVETSCRLVFQYVIRDKALLVKSCCVIGFVIIIFFAHSFVTKIDVTIGKSHLKIDVSIGESHLKIDVAIRESHT